MMSGESASAGDGDGNDVELNVHLGVKVHFRRAIIQYILAALCKWYGPFLTIYFMETW